jgi:GTP cyclohydrolase III
VQGEYYLFDGDRIGSHLNGLLVAGSDEGITAFSEAVTESIQRLAQKLTSASCRIIFIGGDSVLAFGCLNDTDIIIMIREFHMESGATLSVGIAPQKSACLLSLALAKSRGGNIFSRIAERMQ